MEVSGDLALIMSEFQYYNKSEYASEFQNYNKSSFMDEMDSAMFDVNMSFDMEQFGTDLLILSEEWIPVSCLTN